MSKKKKVLKKKFVYIIRKYDVIPLLVEIAKSAVKEKVIRVSIATLRVKKKKRRDGNSYRVTNKLFYRILLKRHLLKTWLPCWFLDYYLLPRI